VVGAGHTAIVDAVFARADERAQIAAVAHASNVPFSGLFLTADLEIRIARVTARMYDASDANATVARQQESYALGAMAWTEIDASGDLGRTLRAAQDVIASHASGSPTLR
jgi:hypothetical protein